MEAGRDARGREAVRKGKVWVRREAEGSLHQPPKILLRKINKNATKYLVNKSKIIGICRECFFNWLSHYFCWPVTCNSRSGEHSHRKKTILKQDQKNVRKLKRCPFKKSGLMCLYLENLGIPDSESLSQNIKVYSILRSVSQLIRKL